MPDDTFPLSLLNKPIHERISYFENVIIMHPSLELAYKEFMQSIRHPAGASIIQVIGPSGAGKTTLRLKVEHALMDEMLKSARQVTSRRPIFGIEVVAPESGNYNWKDYYTRALPSLDALVVGDPLNYEVRGIRRNREGRLVIEGTVVAELRRAYEVCLKRLRLKGVIADEGQHLKKMTSGRRLLDQMDTIKSLASLSETLHILVGTYDLLDLTDLSGQLSRRSIVVHLPRYHLDTKQQREQFINILYSLQQHLPIKTKPDLVKNYEECYQHCLGCIGLLKKWLTQALAAALEDNQSTMTFKFLKKYTISTKKLKTIENEILESEKKYETVD